MNSWAVAAALMGAQAAPVSPVQAPPGRPDAVQNCAAVSARTCVLAHSLGRGVNLGNMLEAPREGDWGVKAEPALIDLAARNFQTVRVPVRWSNHAAPTADATIDEAFAKRVDEVVDRLLDRGVNVILNVHHYNQLTGTPLQPREFAVDPAVVETRFLNLWRQIATRYQNRSDHLVFELLNEPNTRLNGAPWNKLAAEALTVVRASNPTRAVIIGPGDWNNAKELVRLRLPRDKNLIAAVHTYEPYKFTHQGVSWRKDLLTGVRCCDAKQRDEVVDALELARKWNRGSGVPVHLGEFGAHSAGDLTSRANWARLVRDEAEQRGIGWAWWEMASDFSGVYSPENGGWVEPIRRALLD